MIQRMLYFYTMNYRQATIDDIPSLMRVRFSVKENVLSNPGLVTEADCATYITQRGMGWVCEVNGEVVGFAIADLVDHNIWALFVDPAFEGRGIGKRLHDMMLDWYFEQTNATVWLGTSPGTRAELFYTNAGWKNMGMGKHNEIRFEMTHTVWNKRRACR